jgi:DNA primase
MVVREVLTELGAVGWPKTSGSKGLHIYVRIEPRFGFREVRRAALAFAREVERRAPHLVTTNWWKEERPDGAIFLDYNQNAKDRTIAAAYSVRGLPHGPVSAPITWDELPDVEMQDFTIATVPARFASIGDPSAGIDDAVWDVEPLLEWAARDEQDHGLGDAPYPPNFPKMEGEPPRVQPSRMNKANWADLDPSEQPQNLD